VKKKPAKAEIKPIGKEFMVPGRRKK